MKQETLEDFLYQYWYDSPTLNIHNKEAFTDGGLLGAKWQQEKSYSEEDLEKAFKAGEVSMNRAILKDEGYDLNSYNLPNINDFEQWFEQFKKEIRL